MITLGIDLSSQPKGTAACVIRWETGKAQAVTLRQHCTDSVLDDLIEQADVVGIDAPFGWPLEFTAAVADWPHGAWTTEQRDRLRFRMTDRVVRATTGLNPLSVSTDLIALPAMRAMALLKRQGVTDHSGDGRFFEVYPAASLNAWGISNRGYKEAKKPACVSARKAILQSIREMMLWLVCSDDIAATSDTLDALIASLTARAAAQGLTIRPTDDQLAAGRHEGWIHVPLEFPKLTAAHA